MLWQIGLFGNGSGQDPTTIGITQINALLLRGAEIALAVIGAIAFIYIIIAGIQYITSAGDPAVQTQAKKTIQAAIIGFVIAVSAFTLVGSLLRKLGFSSTIIEDSSVKTIVK